MRRNRFQWRVVLLLILGVFSVVGSGPAPARAEGERLVLAFYYNWFDENSWGPNKVPDQPAPTYVSRDRAVMARHIDQAKGAGIDALVVSWYGPREQDNQTETNLRAMLDEAAARGFRLGVDFEVTSPFYRNAGDVQAALKALIATHAQHPAYLRWNGKPVIFFWRQQRFNTATWAAIRAAVDPNHDTIWIEEGVDVAPLSVFDGHHLYSVTWNPPTDMAYTANKFAKRVRDYAAGGSTEGLCCHRHARLQRSQDRPRQRLRGGPRGRRLLRPLLAGGHRQCAGLGRHHQFQRMARGHVHRAKPGLRQSFPGSDRAVVGGLPWLGPTAAAPGSEAESCGAGQTQT